MGKGIVPDSSPYNVSAARSAAFKEADVVLVLGARLNWIMSFGLPPKWNPKAKIIQVDILADELGKNGGDPKLSLVGDIALVVEQLIAEFGNWKWQGQSTPFYRKVQEAKSRNEQKAAKKAAMSKLPMTYERVFDEIKKTLNSLSKPEDGDIVYVSEGANAMDISRTIFTMEHPRVRLDAGTYATMGVGLGYAIAAWAAYNFPNPEGSAGKPGRKKVVAIEGDSAFGFSGMEIETMARYHMDILVFVINNSGLYRGDAENREKWLERQRATLEGRTAGGTLRGPGLSATSLGFETDYQKMADMAGNGAIGLVARTPEEVRKATEQGFKANVPVVVNVIVEQQEDSIMVSSNRSLSLRRRCSHISRTFRGLTWHHQAPKKHQRNRSCEVDNSLKRPRLIRACVSCLMCSPSPDGVKYFKVHLIVDFATSECTTLPSFCICGLNNFPGLLAVSKRKLVKLENSSKRSCFLLTKLC